MKAEDIIRLPEPRHDVRIELREVVLDLHDRPNVFMRARLTGWHFQHRAGLPFLLVGDTVSRFVSISPDGLTADAFFDEELPRAEQVSFGYGNVVAWDFGLPVDTRGVTRLDRERLPKDVSDPFRPEIG